MKDGIIVQMIFSITLFFVAFVIACLNIKSFRDKARAAYVLGVKMLMYFCMGCAVLLGLMIVLTMFLIEDDL